MTINAKPTQLLDIDDVWGGWSEVRYKNMYSIQWHVEPFKLLEEFSEVGWIEFHDRNGMTEIIENKNLNIRYQVSETSSAPTG